MLARQILAFAEPAPVIALSRSSGNPNRHHILALLQGVIRSMKLLDVRLFEATQGTGILLWINTEALLSCRFAAAIKS